MEEHDVGITCYISNLPGFRGVLKQRLIPSFHFDIIQHFLVLLMLNQFNLWSRYSDFIVHEVDLDGKVVELSSLEAIAEESKLAAVESKVSDDFSLLIIWFSVVLVFNFKNWSYKLCFFTN